MYKTRVRLQLLYLRVLLLTHTRHCRCGKTFREYYPAVKPDVYRSCEYRIRGNTTQEPPHQDELIPEKVSIVINDKGEEIRQTEPERWISCTDPEYQIDSSYGCNYHWGGLETYEKFGKPGAIDGGGTGDEEERMHS